VLIANMEKAIDFKVYMPSLEAWFWGEMHKLSSAPFPQRFPFAQTKILMGCPLWGDEYVARFVSLGLPTLMSARNKAALQGRCRIVLFTDVLGYHGLFNLSRDMTQAGLETTVHVVPQEIMAKVGELGLNKYWLLGICQQLMIHMAGKLSMGFHSLFPDHLYAEAYFENMWRIVEANPGTGIAQTGISANIHECVEDIEKFRQENQSLAIPDRALGDMGLKHLHKQMRGNIMNDCDLESNMPNSHYLLWRGRNKLYCSTPHMNAVWIPPESTAGAPIMNPMSFNALDTMLPYFMPKSIYVPDDQDGLGFLEVSDDNKGYSEQRLDFAQYAMQAWNTVHLKDDWNAFTETLCEIPISEQADGYMEEGAIVQQHATLCALLKEAKPRVKEILEDAQRKQDERIAQVRAGEALGKPAKSKRALKRQMQAKRRHNGAEHHAGA
jgi:hypothetical protein